MGYYRDEFDDTWSGLEPEQSEPDRRLLYWVLGGAGVLVLACICLGGGYLLARQFLSEPTPTPVLVVPTQPGLTPPPVGEITRPPTPQVFPTETSPVVAAPTVTLPGQPTVPLPAEGNVEAVRLPAAPVIDGVLSEWATAPTYTSAFRVHQDASWDGTDDLTAVWRLAWDESNLYIGVDVTDNVHVQTQTGNQLFRGDSVDMQFDTDRISDFGDGLSPDDFQIIFSPGDFSGIAESAFRFQGTEAGRILDAPGHGIFVKAQKTATGYTLEAAIPWADLNLTPVPGLVIGLALNASDNDSPGTAVQEVMMSHVSTRTLTNPSGWGSLTLQ